MTTDTTDAPNKAHLLQWARALESGNYKQGDGVLKSEDNEYCCLGVACDIASKDGAGRWEVNDENPAHYAFIAADGSTDVAYLPSAIAEWLDLPYDGIETHINPELDGYSATCRNDSMNNSFNDIAAAVRAEFGLPTKEQDEHRLAWIKALESGDYEQIGGGLRSLGNQFCCLGVACDLAAKDGVGRWDGTTFCTPNASQGAVLPEAVSSWLGVNGPDPILDGSFATKRNDSESNDFAQIAAAARVEFGFPPLEDEIKAHRLKWIEALESGEYEQASGMLRTNSGRYCCLGVACDLANKDGIGSWVDNGFKTDKEFRSAVIPDAVSARLGSTRNDGDLELLGSYATTLNDNQKLSFVEIAAAARKEWGFPPKA